jgi:hypothetical protein
MIEIQCEEPTQSVCKCCGRVSVQLTRFVYRDGDAYAVYYAQYTPEHDPKRVSAIVSLGEWGDGSSPAERVAFPLRIWTDEHNFQMGLTDAADSPWSHVSFMGKILDREVALKHPRIDEVFHITDHMVTDDKEIAGYFEAGIN